MALATDAQVQTFSDQQVRPMCEELRSVQISLTAILGQMDDVYQACVQATPTWHDSRQDGPPHLALVTDIPAMHDLFTRVLAAITGDAQYPILLKLCVQKPLRAI